MSPMRFSPISAIVMVFMSGHYLRESSMGFLHIFDHSQGSHALESPLANEGLPAGEAARLVADHAAGVPPIVIKRFRQMHRAPTGEALGQAQKKVVFLP